jgi:hypothetical protein
MWVATTNVFYFFYFFSSWSCIYSSTMGADMTSLHSVDILGGLA